MAAPITVFASAELDQHTTPDWHPERPGRLDASLAGISRAGLGDAVEFREPRLATVEDLERVHAPSYIAQLERFCERGGGDLDPDTFAAPGSWTTALRAAGAVLDAVASHAATRIGAARVRALCADWPAALAEVRRLLRPDGRFDDLPANPGAPRTCSRTTPSGPSRRGRRRVAATATPTPPRASRRTTP